MTKYLNAKEYNVLYTIFHAEEPMSIAQLTKAHSEMTSNIIQAAIRKLLKLNLIEVADITMERNVFSRRFQPTASASEQIQKMFVDDYIHFSKLISKQALHCALIKADDDPAKALKEINEMKALLQEYKGKGQNCKED